MDKPNSQPTFPETASLNISFGDLASQLIAVKIKVDKQLEGFNKDVETIEAYYAPRAEFDRWKTTDVGKEWKAKQFKSQKGCCAICKINIQLKGSHIDHIKPIAKFPHLNLDTKNLQILCPDCNLRKGDRYIHFR